MGQEQTYGGGYKLHCTQSETRIQPEKKSLSTFLYKKNKQTKKLNHFHTSAKRKRENVVPDLNTAPAWSALLLCEFGCLSDARS